MNIIVNEPRILIIAGKTLLPGVNIVSESEASEVLSHPLTRKWCETGRVTIEKDKLLDVREIGLMSNINDLSQLALSSDEKLAKAAEKRIEEINSYDRESIIGEEEKAPVAKEEKVFATEEEDLTSDPVKKSSSVDVAKVSIMGDVEELFELTKSEDKALAKAANDRIKEIQSYTKVSRRKRKSSNE